MARSFFASDLVALPRMTAINAARLLKSLLHQASQEKGLPAAVKAARDALIPAREALVEELKKRLAGVGVVTPVVRAADIVEDNAFAALVAWLRAFQRLPAERHPESEAAASTLTEVFKNSLEFLSIAPENEWQEAELRIALLEDKSKGHRAAIEKMGGKPFLDEIELAHAAYGKALGITETKKAPESPAIAAALADATDEIRAYVLAVSAQVKRKDPDSQALATRLLHPLIHWKATQSATDDPLSDEAPVAPVAAPDASPAKPA